MATLQRYFPGGVNPDEYNPPIDGLDYMPMLGDLLNSDIVSTARTSTLVTLKFDNGLQAKIVGTGLTFNAAGDATGGTVTQVQILTAQGALIEKITGLSISAKSFDQATDSGSWGLQNLIFSGNDTLNGGDGNDDLFGHAGNNTFNGGKGDDFMVGGTGKDTYNGGAGWDQISFDDTYYTSAAKKGVKVDATTHKATDSYGNIETFSSIESFRGTKFADTFKGSSVDEEFMGLAGNDMIDGGAGFDVVRYHRDVNRGGTKAVTVDLTKGTATDGFGNTDTLKNIEGARGTQYNDKLTGSSVANFLRGDGGIDSLYGKGGNDILVGGAGKDYFYFDTALNKTSNVDEIQDFSVADDTIRLENAIFTKIAGTGTMTSGQFWASANGAAHDADDRILYNKNTGELLYDADGNGKGAAVLFATVTDDLKLTSADFFIY